MSSEPPVIRNEPLVGAGAPPTLGPEPAAKPDSSRHLLAFVLSLCLGLFLADAVVSVVDDSLILLWGIHALGMVRGIVGMAALVTALVVYLLMGLTPMIPKRLFLPITLFNPLAMLVMIPLAIYFYGRLQQVSWAISLCQMVLGLGIVGWVLGGVKLRWPLVGESRLGSRGFHWLNLSGFLLANVLVVLPAVVIYLAVCAALAVDHFSEGFLTLRPAGLTVQARTYVRNDGKTVQLVPMAHVGEADFYHKLSRSFPPDALVLMEGVSDEANLLTNKITYKRMATSLGLAEQQEEFNPVRVQMVRADVDISMFTTNTIGFLNLMMLFHGKGLSAETVLKLLQFSPPPRFEEQLWDDLLRKRNRHVLDELQARLPEARQFVVPWGVAHMPGIAEGIKASGFRLEETRDYTVIRFGSAGKTVN